MPEKSIDLAIIGSGPAGITAAIYAARKNLKIRVFEKEAFGGQAASAIWVENYPGFKRIKGEELMQKFAEHLKEFGIEIEEANGIESIAKKGKEFELATEEKEKLMAKAILICTGTENKKLGIPGEKEFFGKGVAYCAICDGPAFKGKKITVIGGGNSGVTNALWLTEIASEVTLVEFLPELNCDEIYLEQLNESGIKILKNTQAMEIKGKAKAEALVVKDRASGKQKEIPIDGIFIYVGLAPRNALAKSIGCALDEKGFVKVNERNETTISGIFAAGDLRAGALAQTVWAAGDGAKATLAAYYFIRKMQK